MQVMFLHYKLRIEKANSRRVVEEDYNGKLVKPLTNFCVRKHNLRLSCLQKTVCNPYALLLQIS